MKANPLDFVFSGIAIAVLAIIAVFATRWLAVPLSLRLFGPYHVLVDVLVGLLIYGLASALLLRVLATRWPLRPGDYSMDDPFFTYWKFWTVIYEFGRHALLPFSTVFAKPGLVALFGARMGKNTAFAGHMNEPPLISVGDGAVLGQYCVVTAHAITSGRIVLREVRIGRGATVGVGAVVMPGVVIGEGSVVVAGSVVGLGTIIGAGELWGGTPARKLKDLAATDVRG